MPRAEKDRGHVGSVLTGPVTGTDGLGNVFASDGDADGLRDNSGSAGLAVSSVRVPDDSGVGAPACLGPGDDDPRSPVKASEPAPSFAALGPGDDDPRSPARGEAAPIRGPLGPGELDGPDPHEGFVFLTPGPAGPGGVDRGPRTLTRVPKAKGLGV